MSLLPLEVRSTLLYITADMHSKKTFFFKQTWFQPKIFYLKKCKNYDKLNLRQNSVKGPKDPNGAEKSRIRETKHLWTDANSITAAKKLLSIFFYPSLPPLAPPPPRGFYAIFFIQPLPPSPSLSPPPRGF